MNRESILRELEELLSLSSGSLTEEHSLKDIPAWDSVALLGVISLADEINGQDLSPADFQHAKTIGDIINLIEGI